MTVRLDDARLARLVEVGTAAGLDRVGACPARPWTATRSRIEAQRAAGRNGSMAFTYRNPARSTDPTRILRNASTLVVATRSYGAVEAEAEPDASPEFGAPTDAAAPAVSARVARYAAVDHYAALRASLGAVADELRAFGARAVVVADDNSLVDREAAWRAGIGWYGKSSLLLAPGAGSWFVLGAVVTDARLATTDVPRPVPDGCGACTRCLDGCPTAAIVAPGVVDARRCLSWLLQASGPFPLELREHLGDRLYGCDDCQEVCPPNRTVELRTRRTAISGADSRSAGRRDAVELLGLDDDELMERCAAWYVSGRDPRVVRRNLLVIIGNSGTSDPAALGLVDRYRTGADELLAEHAAWAADRLGAGGGAAASGGTADPSRD